MKYLKGKIVLMFDTVQNMMNYKKLLTLLQGLALLTALNLQYRL